MTANGFAVLASFRHELGGVAEAATHGLHAEDCLRACIDALKPGASAIFRPKQNWDRRAALRLIISTGTTKVRRWSCPYAAARRAIVGDLVRPVPRRECRRQLNLVLIEVMPIRKGPTGGIGELKHRIANGGFKGDEIAAMPGLSTSPPPTPHPYERMGSAPSPPSPATPFPCKRRCRRY